MWLVKCKSDEILQSWTTVGAYDNLRSAIVHASQLLGENLMIVVTDPCEKIIWELNDNFANDLDRSLKFSEFTPVDEYP
jgi:hypothetical protein